MMLEAMRQACSTHPLCMLEAMHGRTDELTTVVTPRRKLVSNVTRANEA